MPTCQPGRITPKVDRVVAESKGFTVIWMRISERIRSCNLHHKLSDSLDYSQLRGSASFSTVDSYKLLALTDVADYSSVFYDYLALRRQIVFYIALTMKAVS